MSNCIDDLTPVEFCVRGIVTDNHSSNIHAFSSIPILNNTSSTNPADTDVFRTS